MINVGDTLGATPGTWTNSPTSFTYQWNRHETEAGPAVPIADAFDETYTVVAADDGKWLSRTQTPINGAGAGPAETWAPVPVGFVTANYFEPFTSPQMFESGKALRHNAATGLRLLSLDAADSVADVEIVARTVPATYVVAGRTFLWLRASGAAASENDYFLCADQNNGEFYLGKHVSGVFTKLGTGLTTPKQFPDRRIWMKVRVQGTAIKGRFWLDGDAEPATWQLEQTDSSIAAGGWNGVGSRDGNTYFDRIGIALNGETAPTSSTGLTANQFYKDFGADVVGGLPTGWTQRWDTASSTFVVVDAATDIPPLDWQVRWNQNNSNSADSWSVSGGDLVFAASGTARRLLSWEGPDINDADAELLTTVRPYSNVSTDKVREMLILRGSGLEAAENGYVFYVQNDAGGGLSVNIGKYVAGTFTNLATLTYSWNGTEDFGMRFRVEGTTLSGRIWPTSGAEPEAWTITATDGDITAAGWAGVGRIATAGSTATVGTTLFREVALNVGGGTAVAA